MQITVPDQLATVGQGLRALIGPLLGALVALAIAGHVHLPHFGPAPRPVTPPSPVTPPGPAPKPDWFGWRADGGHKAIAASMPTLFHAAPHLRVRDPNDRRPILLYKAWTTLFRGYPPYVPQQIGDCVSFGHSHANDLLQCVEFCLAKPGATPTPADIQETDTEFVYGEARKVSGGLGLMDGSYGAAAVKAMTTVGMVSRRMVGAEGQYSGRRAKRFGLVGPPSDWEAKASAFKLGAAAQVTTWDELVAALHNGNPVTICTGMGFSLERDAQGFTPRRGRWGHCMFIAGVRFDRSGACVIQSWGMDTPTGPTALEQPPYSFWVDRKDIESILAEGDSWALSKAPHFGATAGAKGHRRRIPDAWRS